MAKLALRHCTPIKKGTKPISATIARSLIKQLSPGWSFNGDAKGLEQEFRFKNFHETMGFVNAVAWIANTEDHHPDLEVAYNRCKLKLTTHAAGGLTVNDFICAAKIDALYTGTFEGTATATAEKTVAMPEPRAQTGTVPRPVSKTPELNMSEAEELLNLAIKTPPPEPTTVNEEDELKLIDPDGEPTQPHLHNPTTGSAPLKVVQPAADVKPQPEPAASEPPMATGQDSQSAGQFLTTVILPPGMQRIQQDKDEEATVISQPDFDDEHIELSSPIALSSQDDDDEVRTMIVPDPQDGNDLEEEENPDLMKTMIIKPPLLDDDERLNAYTDGDETLLINPKSSGRNKPG